MYALDRPVLAPCGRRGRFSVSCFQQAGPSLPRRVCTACMHMRFLSSCPLRSRLPPPRLCWRPQATASRRQSQRGRRRWCCRDRPRTPSPCMASASTRRTWSGTRLCTEVPTSTSSTPICRCGGGGGVGGDASTRELIGQALESAGATGSVQPVGLEQRTAGLHRAYPCGLFCPACGTTYGGFDWCGVCE